MKARPKLSIGIVSYNQRATINQQLFGALATLSSNLGDDVEFLFNDDGSDDGTKQEFFRAAKLQKLEIIDTSTNENQGAAATYRRILNAARGDYFIWVCVDDYFSPEGLTAALRLLVANPMASVCFAPSAVESRISANLKFHPNFLHAEVGVFSCSEILGFYDLPLNSYKDNLIYSLWSAAGLRACLDQIAIQTGNPEPMIGGALLPWFFYKKVYVVSSLCVIHKCYKSFKPSDRLSGIITTLKSLVKPNVRHESTFSFVNSFDALHAVLDVNIKDYKSKKQILSSVLLNHKLKQ